MGIKLTAQQKAFFKACLQTEQLENCTLSQEECESVLSESISYQFRFLKQDESGKKYCDRKELISYLLDEKPKEIERIEDLERSSKNEGLTFAQLR